MASVITRPEEYGMKMSIQGNGSGNFRFDKSPKFQ
jgi:hypothetical protein